MKSTIIQDTSNLIGWEINDTIEVSIKAPTSYKRYLIPKKSGGYRSVFHPAKQTKTIQYALIELVISKLPVHDCAYAYRYKLISPLKRHASLHAGFRYTIRTDMKEFYPSIKPADLYQIINKQRNNNKNTELSDVEKRFLLNVLFILHPQRGIGLAIGAPSSPAISNAVMYEIDTALSIYAKKRNAVYSRYADDLVFSTNKKGDCIKFLDQLRKTLKRVRWPSLTINDDKTMFMSRATRRTITGLFITPDQTVTIGRKNKRYIRKLLFEYKNGKIPTDKIKYLQGYLSFILDSEPAYYNRLVIKYGAEFVSKALGSQIIRSEP